MRTRWKVTKAHRVVSLVRSDRLRSLRAPGDCLLVGRGVDVATGRVLLSQAELVVPGPLPLELRRHYDSSLCRRPLTLGNGWSHVYEQAVWLEAGKVVVRTGDGREVELDTLHLPGNVIRRGDSAEPPLDAFVLRCTGVHRFRIEPRRGPTLHFERVAGDPDENVARLVTITHPAGPELRLEYGRHARLEAVRDAVGRELTFEHDARGRLDSVTFREPGGRALQRVAVFERSAEGDLLAVHDAEGRALAYAYEDHLLVRASDRTGRSTYYGYDGIGPGARCVRTWTDGAGDDRELRHRPNDGATVVVDGTGRKRTYRFDPVGTLLGDSERGTFAYDDELRLVATTDLDGRTTRFEHDVRGHVSKIVDPDGRETLVELDAAGRPERVVAPDGSEWRWRWDRFGQLVESFDPLGQRTGFEHDAGLLRAVVRPGGDRTELEYDAGLNVSVVRRAGAESRVAYDWLGRPIAVAEAGGPARALRWDTVGRLTEARRADGSSVLLGYDRDSRLVSIEDEGGSYALSWDAAGRLESRRGPDGELRIERDAEGRVVAVHGLGEGTWRFVRDGLGRVTEETTPTGARWAFRYAGAHRTPSLLVPPDGGKVELTRDERGRVVQIRHGSHSLERFAYDALGRLTEATRDRHTVRIERDAAGRVVREVQGEDWVETRYDAAGRRLEVTDSFGTTLTFLRSALGHVDALEARRGSELHRLHVQRDPGGEVAVRWLPGRVVVQWTRDAEGRATGRASWRGEQPVEQVEIGRDARGRVTSVASSLLGLHRYTRDAQGAVSASTLGGSRVVSREALAQLGGLVYDVSGRLTERRDADGRRWRLRWTSTGLLDEVTPPDGPPIRYTYDAYGRRVAKSSSRWSVRWVWDGARAIAELSTESPPTFWLHEPEADEPFGKLSAGRGYFAASEADAIAAALHDEAGNLAWSAMHDICGFASPETRETAWPWRRGGRYEDDEAGLVYARLRYWVPGADRWACGDPWGIATGVASLGGPADPLEPTDPWGMPAGVGPTGRAAWLELADRLPHSLLVARRASDEAFAELEHRLLVPPCLAWLGRGPDPLALLRASAELPLPAMAGLEPIVALPGPTLGEAEALGERQTAVSRPEGW